ncbi:hypothetical protein N7453_009672 [Penicillium expansum]|nr:hypothetical protein N7453_009672 [Penicillium expansum]
MDPSEYLRILARLDTRAVRAERAQIKLEQALGDMQATLKHAIEDRDHVSRLADIFYELTQKMGGVIDYLLKERGAKKPGHEPESTHIILDVLLKQLEIQESDISDGNVGDSEIGGTKAAELSS